MSGSVGRTGESTREELELLNRDPGSIQHVLCARENQDCDLVELMEGRPCRQSEMKCFGDGPGLEPEVIVLRGDDGLLAEVERLMRRGATVTEEKCEGDWALLVLEVLDVDGNLATASSGNGGGE